MGRPNRSYYLPHIQSYPLSESQNKKLGIYAAKCKMSCGGEWIIGKDWMVEISLAADSYISPFTQVFVIKKEDMKTEKDIKGYHELRRHLTEVTEKDYDPASPRYMQSFSLPFVELSFDDWWEKIMS